MEKQESIEPSTTARTGQADRNEKGQFVNGNSAAVGNPHAARVAQIRSLLLSEVKDDDLVAIIKTLIAQAVGGDMQASREILDRLIGKPNLAIAIDASIEQSAILPDDFTEYIDWKIEKEGDEK